MTSFTPLFVPHSIRIPHFFISQFNSTTVGQIANILKCINQNANLNERFTFEKSRSEGWDANARPFIHSRRNSQNGIKQIFHTFPFYLLQFFLFARGQINILEHGHDTPQCRNSLTAQPGRGHK